MQLEYSAAAADGSWLVPSLWLLALAAFWRIGWRARVFPKTLGCPNAGLYVVEQRPLIDVAGAAVALHRKLDFYVIVRYIVHLGHIGFPPGWWPILFKHLYVQR
jgi:hypothetical protein